MFGMPLGTQDERALEGDLAVVDLVIVFLHDLLDPTASDWD
jgi:hypothetical protein